jgi:hypothetical protein
MFEPGLDIYSPLNKKVRKILLILAAILFTISLACIILGRFGDIVPLSLLLVLLCVCTVIGLTKKYYNWNLTFLLFIVIAIIFRSQRWHGAQYFYEVGFTGLSCLSFCSSIIFLLKFDHQRFLKYIGFTFSIILSEVAIGLLFKNEHWPGAGLLLTVGLVAFIPFLFAFLFTLPGSNYINWQKSDRTVFFRAVIIPMIFVYTLCVLMFVIPDLWQSLTRLPLTPFYMEQVEFFDKVGLH